MIRHLQREIESIKTKLLSLCALVEKNVTLATRSVAEQDEVMAQFVMNADAAIDEMEVELEEDCLKALALYQPVAVDLRALVAVLKINNDLERIGDLAVNIAERASFLAEEEEISFPMDFPEMIAKAQWMLRNGLDALVNLDMDMARRVGRVDDEVDEMNRHMYEQVKKGIRETPRHLNQFIDLLCASRHIERIADHATNIAEDVLYMGEGEIVRHAHERRPKE